MLPLFHSRAVLDCILLGIRRRGVQWGDMDFGRGVRTDRVVFDHAHGQGRPRAGEGVEVARHGHGEEAHIDNA